MPRIPKSQQARREMDARGQQVGQALTVDITLDGGAALERSSIEQIQGPLAMKRAQHLAFAEEPVTILIHDSTDENAERVIMVGVQGVQIFIPRNEQVVVKRKFVEVLARAKRQSFRQDLSNTHDVEQYNRLHGSSALQYPFSIIEDRNPLGAPYIQAILAEAA